jgi:hypothetical protein
MKGDPRGPRIPCLFERLGRRLRATPMGFIQLPLTLAPALERPTRRVIAGVPCLGGLMAATPSGICRGRLNGNGGTSQETSNSRSQKNFFPHRLTPFRKICPRCIKQSIGLRVPAKSHLFAADPLLRRQKLRSRHQPRDAFFIPRNKQHDFGEIVWD